VLTPLPPRPEKRMIRMRDTDDSTQSSFDVPRIRA
jgi:hypothetical protein